MDMLQGSSLTSLYRENPVRADDIYEARIAEYRGNIAEKIAQGRAAFCAALEPGAPRTFRWAGQELWVDRVRWLALSARHVAQVASLDVDTLPTDSQKAQARLSRVAGAGRNDTGPNVLQTLAELAVGVRHSMRGGDLRLFFNDVVIQPLVNPAFEPLYWIALGYDNDALAHPNFYRVLAPLMFDMTRWPESRADAALVRRGQIEAIAEVAPSIDVSRAAELSDDAWAATCAEALRSKQALMELRVWLELDRYAASVRS